MEVGAPHGVDDSCRRRATILSWAWAAVQQLPEQLKRIDSCRESHTSEVANLLPPTWMLPMDTLKYAIRCDYRAALL